MFGASGGVSPQASWNRAAYGRALDGKNVTSPASYVAAVQQLRSFSGHNPQNASMWSFPPAFDKYDTELSSTDPRTPSGNSILAQIQALHSMGIEPMAVQWTTVRVRAAADQPACERAAQSRGKSTSRSPFPVSACSAARWRTPPTTTRLPPSTRSAGRCSSTSTFWPGGPGSGVRAARPGCQGSVGCAGLDLTAELRVLAPQQASRKSSSGTSRT